MDSHEHCVKVSLADRSYDIIIKPGLLQQTGSRLHQLGFSSKAAIVTDTTVGPLYAARVLRSLKEVGFDARIITLPAGERVKTLRSVSRILDHLATERFERRSVLVALGGGVIGDLTGFAAAIYVRGIPFIQIPTTLVAQVDSSVGGKTGVNHVCGKNLIGAFYQPRVVLIDPTTLTTLPRRQWTAGLAEVIKYGVIADAEFFQYLEENLERLLNMESASIAHIIGRSCEIKASVVVEDERESDRRRILNYGHTVGHALEALGKYRTLAHGEAVGIGMVAEADIARHLGVCSSDVVSRQQALVSRSGLPHLLPHVTFSNLWSAMQHDKKIAQGRLYCVLPEEIGRVRITPLERTDIKQWFTTRRVQSGSDRVLTQH